MTIVPASSLPVATGSPGFMQRAANNIAHKVYTFQKSICSDQTLAKILLYSGQFFQTSGLFLSGAAFTSVFIVGPIGLMGVVAAIALGILGTVIVDNPHLLSMSRPFVPGQPIGLRNTTAADCWINASLQLLANFPASYSQRLRQIQEPGQTPIFDQFLNSYAQAGNEYSKVDYNFNTNDIRQFLHRMTGGDVEAGNIHGDAADLFQYVFEGDNGLYNLQQQIFQPQIQAQAPARVTTPAVVANTPAANTSAPAPATTPAAVANAPAANTSVTALATTTATAPTMIPRDPTNLREPMIQIALGQTGALPNLQTLFNGYLNSWTDERARIRLSFPQAPNDLLIHAKRFYQDARGEQKINTPFDCPEYLTIPQENVLNATANEAMRYQPDAFIVHEGAALNGGHYVAFVKRGEVWWYINDSYVYEVSREVARSWLRFSYVSHWSKVS